MAALPYVVAFVLALLATLATTPLVAVLARRLGAMDRPDERKVHSVPTPRWGGLGVYVSLLLSVGLVLGLFPSVRAGLTPRLWDNLTGMLAGATLMVALGMADDRWGLPARWKLAGQILVAAVMLAFGIRIEYLSNPFNGLLVLSFGTSVLVTVFWLVGITNAMNLLDGLDGLLAGVSLISAVVFLVVSALQGQWLVVLVMAALAGSCLGFLRYNFNPAQIFMGDSGSLLLGLWFSGWAVIGMLKSTTALALAIPICIMGLPILDTSLAIIRRSLARRSIFSPDKEHLHHRLLGLGLSQRQTVVLIYFINVLFGLMGLALAVAVK
ncbi:MAG TPA: MraY family glycosyltransferase [Candidatus Nitrosotenuis sp.]|nr:MraY family glycosyltransferase [Candidatus Nitrosotenuis sp.]